MVQGKEGRLSLKDSDLNKPYMQEALQSLLAEVIMPMCQPDKVFTADEVKYVMWCIEEKLNPKQQKIIKARYGLDGEGHKTFKQIGQIMRCSYQWASTQTATIQRKLRYWWLRKDEEEGEK